LYSGSTRSASKALRYSTHCQGISQFYLHTLRFIRKRNEPYLPLPSQPQLVLIYRPRRDGRLSRPWREVAQAEIRTHNLPIANLALYHSYIGLMLNSVLNVDQQKTMHAAMGRRRSSSTSKTIGLQLLITSPFNTTTTMMTTNVEVSANVLQERHATASNPHHDHQHRLRFYRHNRLRSTRRVRALPPASAAEVATVLGIVFARRQPRATATSVVSAPSAPLSTQ